MTTITNFLEGNFIANPESKAVQRPIWVLNGVFKNHNLRFLINHFTNRCSSDKKPYIHLDLGISTMNKITQKSHFITSQSGLRYVKLQVDSPGYIVYTDIKQRIKTGFLVDTLNKLAQDTCSSHTLRKDKQKLSGVQGWGLIVEGIEAFTVLTKRSSQEEVDIQKFIGNLSILPSQFRQIVIVTNPMHLPDQINFGLERLSTCLTKVMKFDKDVWECISTVRRFTGYFKEEHYTIALKEGRVKVAKIKHVKNQQKTNEQLEMLSGLGFKVEKDEQARRKQKELREMIFPHLKKRKVCESGSCQSGCECIEKPLQDLIILDEEQEDDEDLDV